MFEIKSEINSKEWYNFAQAFYNIYPSWAQDFTDIFLFLNSPKIRYIVSTRGTASEASLIAILDELILCKNKDEDLKASIIKLLSNSAISDEVTKHFITHASVDIILSILENEEIVSNNYNTLLAKKSQQINLMLAKHLPPSHPEFVNLPNNKDINILEGLLQNRYISEDTLTQILHKFKFELPSTRAAARNPILPYELMIEWSQSKDLALQRTLALNPNINLEAQEILSCSADERTLVNLANNRALSEEIAERFLSSLYSDSIRLALAGNNQIPQEIANQLLISPNDSIRAEALASRHIPADHIAQIAIDETELSAIKQIVLKHNIDDQLWMRLYQRAQRKTGNIAFFYMKELNENIIAQIKNNIAEEHKYLFLLQPKFITKKKNISTENLITSVSRLIKTHVSKGTLSDDFVLDEVQALLASEL